ILLMIEGDTRAMADVDVAAASALTDGRSRARSWRQYFHFSSLALVAVLMAIGLTPFRAVFWATAGAVVVWMLMREDERPQSPNARTLGRALADAGEDVLPVIATTAVAGIIVGVITLTGLGLKPAG